MTRRSKILINTTIAITLFSGCSAPVGVNQNAVNGATIGAITSATNAATRGASGKDILIETAVGATVGGLTGMAVPTTTTPAQ